MAPSGFEALAAQLDAVGADGGEDAQAGLEEDALGDLDVSLGLAEAPQGAADGGDVGHVGATGGAVGDVGLGAATLVVAQPAVLAQGQLAHELAEGVAGGCGVGAHGSRLRIEVEWEDEMSYHEK